MGNRYHPVTSAIRSKTGRAAHSAVPAPRPSGAGELLPLPSGYLAVLLTVLCAVGFSFGTPSEIRAQTVAACGLPASGTINSATTYTLTGNCTQTNLLHIKAAVTIEGNGYTISIAGVPSSNNAFYANSGRVILRDVTIANGNGNAPFYLLSNAVSLDFDNVTFSGNTSQSSVVVLQSGRSAGTTETFSSVLFEGNTVSGGTAGVIAIATNTNNVTLKNVVFKNNSGGAGPINFINAGNIAVSTSSISYASGSCATFSGNTPHNIGNAAARGFTRPQTCDTAKLAVGNVRPTNVQATAGDGEVTLNWALRNGGAVILQFRQKAGSGSYGTWSTAGSGSSHTVTGLTNGTEYTFQLRAKYASDFVSVASQEVSETPLVPVPLQPTLIEQKRTGGGTSGPDQFVVFWDTPYDAVRPATSFDVQYSADCGTTWNDITNADGDSLIIYPVLSARTTIHHTDGSDNLLPATRHKYRVRAKNFAGNSAWTETTDCLYTFAAGEDGQIPAPERPTAVLSSARTAVRIRVKRPISGSTTETYELQRRPADCGSSVYSEISTETSADATKDFNITGIAQPAGTNLYRARVAGGSWSLPVAIRTKADGTMKRINHVSVTSLKDRHDPSSMMCVAP